MALRPIRQSYKWLSYFTEPFLSGILTVISNDEIFQYRVFFVTSRVVMQLIPKDKFSHSK
jgi:hypothetical protein